MVGPCTSSCTLEAAGYTKQGPHLQRPKVELQFYSKPREQPYYLTSYPLVTREDTGYKSGSSVIEIIMMTVVLAN